MKLNLGLGSTKFVVTALLFLLGATGDRLHAAAAVATGLGSDGKMHCGVDQGGTRGEDAVRSRALASCIASGGLHPKVIASASKRGYGVVVRYEIAHKKYDFTAAVGASSLRQALAEALGNVPASGKHGAELTKAWCDVPNVRNGHGYGHVSEVSGYGAGGTH